jgi:small redox-active disulfide protein 2
MTIEVLGPGCAKCQTLAENAKAAIEKLGLDCELVKVSEIDEIVKRGVMMTPALIVDGVVRSVGRVVSADQIASFLEGD